MYFWTSLKEKKCTPFNCGALPASSSPIPQFTERKKERADIYLMTTMRMLKSAIVCAHQKGWLPSWPCRPLSSPSRRRQPEQPVQRRERSRLLLCPPPIRQRAFFFYFLRKRQRYPGLVGFGKDERETVSLWRIAYGQSQRDRPWTRKVPIRPHGVWIAVC